MNNVIFNTAQCSKFQSPAHLFIIASDNIKYKHLSIPTFTATKLCQVTNNTMLSGLHCSDCSAYVLVCNTLQSCRQINMLFSTMLPPSLGYKWAGQGYSVSYIHCLFLPLFCWTHGELNHWAMLILYSNWQDITEQWFPTKRRPYRGRVQARWLTQGTGKDRTHSRLIIVNRQY
jgi:hypothetical protein